MTSITDHIIGSMSTSTGRDVPVIPTSICWKNSSLHFKLVVHHWVIFIEHLIISSGLYPWGFPFMMEHFLMLSLHLQFFTSKMSCTFPALNNLVVHSKAFINLTTDIIIKGCHRYYFWIWWSIQGMLVFMASMSPAVNKIAQAFIRCKIICKGSRIQWERWGFLWWKLLMANVFEGWQLCCTKTICIHSGCWAGSGRICWLDSMKVKRLVSFLLLSFATCILIDSFLFPLIYGIENCGQHLCCHIQTVWVLYQVWMCTCTCTCFWVTTLISFRLDSFSPLGKLCLRIARVFSWRWTTTTVLASQWQSNLSEWLQLQA